MLYICEYQTSWNNTQTPNYKQTNKHTNKLTKPPGKLNRILKIIFFFPQGIDKMEGKTALVTGSTSGIGLGIAHHLAEKGCNIVLTGLGEQGLIDSIVQEFKQWVNAYTGITIRREGNVLFNYALNTI